MKRFPLIQLLALATGFFFTGCAFKQGESDIYRWERPSLVDGDRLFGYSKQPIEAGQTLIERRDTYDIYRISFDAYFRNDPDNLKVSGLFYKQRTERPVPSIMQIPILGGDYEPETSFAEYYARHGFNVLRPDRKQNIFDPKRGLEYSRRLIIASVVDIRRALDWWETEESVDRARIGVSGISMGGFQGSVLMSVDPRIKAGAFMLNGCDFAKLMMVSSEGEVIDVRKGVEKENGWSEEEFFAHAKAAFDDIDPLVYAPNLNPARILFIAPRFDRVVPYTLAQRWRENANRPEMITIPTGHYSSVVFIRYIQRKCLEHFRKVFAFS